MDWIGLAVEAVVLVAVLSWMRRETLSEYIGKILLVVVGLTIIKLAAYTAAAETLDWPHWALGLAAAGIDAVVLLWWMGLSLVETVAAVGILLAVRFGTPHLLAAAFGGA